MEGKMLRRLATLVVVCATACGVTTGVASAGKPVGGCPNANFTLVPTDETDPVEVFIDKNNDGSLCVKNIGAAVDTNFVDNTSHSN